MKSNFKIYLILVLLIASNSLKVKGQSSPIFLNNQSKNWADSVLSTMSYTEKIGQLFMVDAFSNKDQVHVDQITALIDSFKIGGLIFFQGGPIRQAMLTNYYQQRSKIKLMIGIDGEWGLSMRLDSTMRFPRQMTMSAGASSDDVYKIGKEIAKQCKRMGIQINFAPDIDINNNPLNPIINSRSFGQDKNKVTELGNGYMRGMQDEGVLACGKHFPGHGNTDSDSHLALPLVTSTLPEIDSVELMPFRKLIQDSLASVMVAHLNVPAIDTITNQPSTLSYKTVTGLLKGELGFKGLIFTDALNMKGVADFFTSGDLEVKALKAGNDVLLYSQDVPKAIEKIHLAIQNCDIEQEEIDAKVLKILMAKYWSGLNNYHKIDTLNLRQDLYNSQAQWLNYSTYDKAPTLLRNKNEILPLSTYYKNGIASLVINDTINNNFQQQLNKYAKIDCFSIDKEASSDSIEACFKRLLRYDRVIISIHNTSTNATKNFNINDNIKMMFKNASEIKDGIICVFGNPYVLGKFNLSDANCLVLGYEDTYLPQIQVAQKIFGASSFSGRLPVSPPGIYSVGMGMSPTTLPVLKYSLPEAIGINTESFSPIDSIINKAILDSVFPGCQILAAANGTVFYNKAFGYHTYDKSVAVSTNDMYDIASVTKIASTALAAMYLVENHRLNLDEEASHYLRELRKSNKKDITIRQIMAHQAGLVAWIPFWKSTVDSQGLKNNIYRSTVSDSFSVRVADSIYIRNDYRDSIWQEIINSPVETPGKYVYSDLGLIILQHVIEKITHRSLESFVTDSFFKPLGLWKLTYHPLENTKRDLIVPTEYDSLFRKQLIIGDVHDPAAAMLGGACGHAGIFSNAQALAVIMQMLLNDGVYGDKRYFKKETIEQFTNVAFPLSSNRRGLLFDKPDADSKQSPAASSASLSTFGHQGFTGTCAWVDPESGLVYIFLSNRVFPSAANNKLAKQNIRTNIMEVFCRALKNR
jgi:beta-glucosidase-like glycosyl hydrolase/CubicO group peptidase (beta-lactamase class C family)